MLHDYLTKILTADVYDLAVQTPLTRLDALSRETGASIWLKREDLQPIYSFKLRGAANKISALRGKADGVICASAGNHAQGVAMAAKHYGMKATIVMPVTTPAIKIDAVRALGGETVVEGATYDDSCAHALALSEKTGDVFVHAFDDPDVIAGQGTVAVEILQQMSGRPHAIFVPVGGGGLIAGIGAYIKSVLPEILVIGVEPEGAAGMAKSLNSKRRVSLDTVDRFADGVAVKDVGVHTFELCRQVVDDIILVTTDEICAAVRDTFEGARAIVEPAGALALAGIKKYAQTHDVAGKDLVAINSGANVNFDRFGTIVERAELGAGGEILLAVTIPERAGAFLEFCRLIGQLPITEFNYRFASNAAAQVLAGIRLRGGPVRGAHNPLTAERDKLIAAIEAAGLPVRDLTDNEMAKQHIRHMVGGRIATPEPERVFRFEFPERPGALSDFLTRLAGRWSISLFHYRNHGAAYGQVLAALMVPPSDNSAFLKFLDDTGYEYREETANPAYTQFLQPEFAAAKTVDPVRRIG